MKYTLEYSEWLYNDNILYDKSFLYQLSRNKVFTESEGNYIRNILKRSKKQTLTEDEFDLFFNFSDIIFEGFFSNINDKIKSSLSNIANKVSNVFNYVHTFIKKYIDEIINSFDRTFNIFGHKNDEANQKMADSLYNRYKENINTLVKKNDKEEILWYNKCYDFLMSAYNTVLSTIKSLFISESKEMIKESILIDNIIFENEDQKHIDDQLNDQLKKIKNITIKIDKFINTKFLWLFKILNSVTNFTVQGFAKTISVTGGPTEPKNGFKTTSATFLYVIQNKYLELTSYISRFTNTKTFVSGLFKTTFKRVVQHSIPGTNIMFKLIGLINNIDITRRLLNTIENNKN